MDEETIKQAFTDENAGFQAEATQFMRPDGKQVTRFTRLPNAVKDHYQRMLDANCRFEVEVCEGKISISISDGEKDLGMKLTDNGPQVQIIMVELLQNLFPES